MAKKNPRTTERSDAPDVPAPVSPRRASAAPPRAAADTVASRPDPTHEQIAEAAYQRYLSRGGGHGRDFDDWLEAERELRVRSATPLVTRRRGPGL